MNLKEWKEGEYILKAAIKEINDIKKTLLQREDYLNCVGRKQKSRDIIYFKRINKVFKGKASNYYLMFAKI